MADTEVKNNDTSTESTTGANTSLSSGISSTPTSVNSAVDDKKYNSISSGANIQTQASTVSIGTKTNVSSGSSTSSSVPISTVEVKYPIEELIKNTKALTGHKREVAVGALFSCKEKELTKDDFKKAIEIFLKRKVK